MLEKTEFQVKINCINPLTHDLRVALLLKPLERTTLVWESFASAHYWYQVGWIRNLLNLHNVYGITL